MNEAIQNLSDNAVSDRLADDAGSVHNALDNLREAFKSGKASAIASGITPKESFPLQVTLSLLLCSGGRCR
jgi:hypothetical protein